MFGAVQKQLRQRKGLGNWSSAFHFLACLTRQSRNLAPRVVDTDGGTRREEVQVK